MGKRIFANGWTKAKVRAQVKKYNNGTPAMVINGKNAFLCSYNNCEGNRCFIGAFIPNNHKGLQCCGAVSELLDTHRDLPSKLPFAMHGDLVDFQRAHDQFAKERYDGDTYRALEAFLEGCED